MEIRLQDRDYLAGPGRGIYGAADINVFPWWVPAFNPNLLVTYDHGRIRGHGFAGIESLDEWPNFKVGL